VIDGKIQSDVSKVKKNNIKIVTTYGDSRSAKAGKPGSGNSIKQFSTQPHPTYLSTLRICTG